MKTIDHLDDFLMMNSKYMPTNYNKLLIFLAVIGIILVIACVIYYKRWKKKPEDTTL